MQPVNLSSIDLNLLVVLEALLSEAHVRRAGERVGLSQPATSHALARLRALFGDPLLVRSGTTMRRTPRAEALRAPLAEVLAGARSLLTEVAFDPATSSRAFTFMMPDLVCDLLGPPLVARTAETAPGVQLRFTAMRGPQLLHRRDLDAIDFVITSLQRDFPGFTAEPLYADHDLLAVRRGHPASRQLGTAAGFRAARHIAVIGAGEVEDVSESWLTSVGLRREIALAVPTYLLALRIAARTDLVAFAPRRLVSAVAEGLALEAIAPPIDPGSDQLLLSSAERLRGDPAADWMRALLFEIADSLDLKSPGPDDAGRA